MTKKLLTTLLMAIAFTVSANAQGWLKKVKDRAVSTVENAVSNKVNKETSDDAASKDAEMTKQQDDTPDAVSQNQKSDFVRGSVILFEDDFAGEQLGEFPSKWDINHGSVETASVNGKKYLNSSSERAEFTPLMKNMMSYLPEVFTLEWDVFYCKPGDIDQSALQITFYSGNDELGNIYLMYRPGSPDSYGDYSLRKGGGSEDYVTASIEWVNIQKYIKLGQWNHFAISFNKRAFKYYINGNRVINLPNVAAPSRFQFMTENGEYPYRGVGHVILAKGGVDLYQRQTTDLSAIEKAIAETGKFVTNNILFETGKATLKPESMAEIQKVADYMKKNSQARFEVQGHTDNQGSDAINDPLSQKRAEAVVKALEGMGCDPFNLRPVGKGSHEPVADNSTDAGRAQNRRVEFIKK